VVVVVGVLLALLAAEWAETQRAKAEAEQAVDSMARENAEALGALQKLPFERALSIAFLYSIADTAYDANYKRYAISRSLAELSLKRPPSLAERRKLLGTLGEINDQHDLFFRYASGALGNWDAFPEKPKTMPADWKRLKQVITEREEKLGDCALTPPSNYGSSLLED